MSKRIRRKRLHRLFHKRRSLPGAPPGQVVPDPESPAPEITVIAYGPGDFVEKRIEKLDTLHGFTERWPVTWVNIDGLGDAKIIKQIGEIFGLHALALEDVVNVHQRAKVDEFDGQLFIVARMLELTDHLDTEQVSIFLGKNYIVTFQERPGADSFGPVRERIRKSHGRIRTLGADYLCYGLIDAVIDAYFPVLEAYGDRLEELEAQVMAAGNGATIARIHDTKSELRLIRRALWPHREMVNALVRDPCTLITQETRIHLRDCYDHTAQLLDLVETLRELAGDLHDLYLTSVSNRMNEIIKVLTIISTIFIPLTFIAGVYGMNFEHMPELKWRYGYAFSLALMAAVTAAMFYFFYRKGWLRRQAIDVEPEAANQSTRQVNQKTATGGRVEESAANAPEEIARK